MHVFLHLPLAHKWTALTKMAAGRGRFDSIGQRLFMVAKQCQRCGRSHEPVQNGMEPVTTPEQEIKSLTYSLLFKSIILLLVVFDILWLSAFLNRL